ncbi:MAG: hypothetical protein U9M89_02495 [Patescibacteria group bacterium]|nr:hypothetical protein [Patescibacteria group bacterium]
MKYFKATTFMLITGAFLMLGFDAAEAQVNSMLNFAGKVTNTDGTEVADGVYDFSFGLYANPAGGTAVWSEDLTAATRFSATIASAAAGATSTVYAYSGATATGTLRLGQYLSTASSSAGALIVDYNTLAGTVTAASGSPLWTAGEAINNRPFVEGGVININLGSVSDISGVDFNQTLYLEITFNSETMQPRKILTSSPQAFDAARIGGKSESELATLAEDEAITGEWSFNNSLSVTGSSTDAVLTVTQNGSGNIMEVKQGTTTCFAVLADGRVQIGDYRFPAAHPSTAGYILKTDVGGNLYWAVDFTGNFGIDGRTLWATSSDESRMYPIDSGYVVVIGNDATTTFDNHKFEVYGTSLFDDILIGDQQELKFYDADSSHYISLRASSTIASNIILTLPIDAGVNNQALITDGNGNLSWGAPANFTYVNPGLAGQMPYYASGGSTLSATSSIFLSPAGYFGIGTATPANLLSVGSAVGSQFMVDASGQVVAGTWLGNAIADTQIASSAYWNTAYNWGDHAQAGYMSTSSGHVLEIAYGGTGQINLNDLIELTTHTAGDYVASTTGSPTITITGTPGEGWAPVFSVTDDSITAGKLAVINNGAGGQVLISDGDGTFSWSDAGASSGWVRYGSAGALAFYETGGIQATGTNLLYWDDSGSRLAIGTTSPSQALTIGATIGSQFLVNSLGVVLDGEWTASPIADAYIASSTYWNLAYFAVTGSSTYWDLAYAERGSQIAGDYLAWDGSQLDVAGVFSTSTGNVLEVAYGGTGSSTWAQYAIPYLTDTDEFGQIKIGTSTYVLAVNASGNGYTWVEASSTGVVLSQEQVDDYTDALINDPDSVHSLISITYDDPNNAMDFEVESDLSQYDNSASAFFSTSTDVLDVSNGGTGKSSWTGYAIPYATTTGFAEITKGSPNQILAVNAGGDGYTWISSGSVGEDELVAIDGGAAAGYIGATSGDGVLRTSSPLSYTDGGAYITLGITSGAIGDTELEYDTGQHLTTASLPTFAGLTLTNFGAGIVIVSGDTFGTTTNNTASWNAAAASSTYYNTAYNIVNSNNANWTAAYASTTVYDSMYASSSFYTWAYNTVNNNYLDWNADFASSTYYNTAYNLVNSKYSNWDAVYASSTYYDADYASSSFYTWAYNTVNDNYSDWDTAFGWGNWSDEDFFSTSTGNVLEVAYGGTGQANLNNLITLGAHTTGNYVSSTTGSDTITITGTPGEGWVPVFSVTGNSIGADQLAVSGDGNAGYVLTSDSDGTFSWSDSSGSGQVAYGAAGSLAFYSSVGIVATGTTLLTWDNSNYYLGIGTTTMSAMLTVGATSSQQFLVNSIGQVVAGTWLGSVIDIAYGGTGATTATSARANLGLSDVHKFGINSTGTVSWLWQSDGDGRGHWVATGTLGLGGTAQKYAKFIGTTTATTDGSFATGTLQGYAAGNAICDYEFPGSFLCRTYDILLSIEQDDISSWAGSAWIAEGPPGFTSNSNDCNGWTSSATSFYGAFWAFDSDGGGMGWLTGCSNSIRLACCAWQ